MDLSYVVSREQLRQAQYLSGRYLKSRIQWPPAMEFLANIGVWMVIGFSASMLFDATRSVSGGRSVTAMWAVVGLVAAMLSVFVLNFLRQQSAFRRALDLQGPFPLAATLKATDEGLESASSNGRWFFPQKQISHAVEREGQVFVVMHTGYVVVVSADAFHSAEQRQEFLGLVRSWAAV